MFCRSSYFVYRIYHLVCRFLLLVCAEDLAQTSYYCKWILKNTQNTLDIFGDLYTDPILIGLHMDTHARTQKTQAPLHCQTIPLIRGRNQAFWKRVYVSHYLLAWDVLTGRDPSLATQVYQCQQQGSATHPYIWIKQSESLQRMLLTF